MWENTCYQQAFFRNWNITSVTLLAGGIQRGVMIFLVSLTSFSHRIKISGEEDSGTCWEVKHKFDILNVKLPWHEKVDR